MGIVSTIVSAVMGAPTKFEAYDNIHATYIYTDGTSRWVLTDPPTLEQYMEPGTNHTVGNSGSLTYKEFVTLTAPAAKGQTTQKFRTDSSYIISDATRLVSESNNAIDYYERSPSAQSGIQINVSLSQTDQLLAKIAELKAEISNSPISAKDKQALLAPLNQQEKSVIQAKLKLQEVLQKNPIPKPVVPNPPTANATPQTNVQAARNTTASQPPKKEAIKWEAMTTDWRVRLAMSPNSKCLYQVAEQNQILYPLRSTNGVVFPYVPQISLAYTAQYNPTDLTHTNYKFYTYQNSAVDEVSIQCDFTAQDTKEADYLLAVIHFFKSVTKMFYGQDKNPPAGTPPPLCYLFGMGKWQFDGHPLLISNFSFTLPTDVDYIRAGSVPITPGGNADSAQPKDPARNQTSADSRTQSGQPVGEGGAPAPVRWNTTALQEVTYVPTKVTLQLRAIPVVSRNDVSNEFSLASYAAGDLQGNKHYGVGFW